MDMDLDMDFDFGDLLEERIQKNFGENGSNAEFDASDDRLKEMNKKLPQWSLEPPFSFLK